MTEAGRWRAGDRERRDRQTLAQNFWCIPSFTVTCPYLCGVIGPLAKAARLRFVFGPGSGCMPVHF